MASLDLFSSLASSARMACSAIVVGIDGSSPVQIGARLLQIAEPQLGLRRAQLVANFFRLGIGGARVGVGRLLLVAVQFVGVAQVGQHRRRHLRRALQGCDRGLVIVLFAVVVRRGLEDFDIARRMLLRRVEHLLGAVRLFQLQISHRQHQLGVRVRLLATPRAAAG